MVTFEGRVEHGAYRFGADDLLTLPRRGFKAVTPWVPDPMTFDGISVVGVLSEAVSLAGDADTAVFYGERGYRAAVPLPVIRQMRPILADRASGGPLAGWRTGAAPLQLAWPTLDHPGIDTDPRLRWWWVGGVSRVELQTWTKTYGKALRVPVGARDDARRGSELVSISCITCHQVRGTGGTAGPPLTAAPRDPARFAGYLSDHFAKVSASASAPAISAADAARIAAFLRAVEMGGEPPTETSSR